MSDSEKPAPGTRRVGRSPSYPAIALDTALERAAVLWGHEHHYSAPVAAVLGHWGYASKSGGGLAALAALKNFGLIEDEGRGDERRVKLTADAIKLVNDPPENERLHLLRKAALTPKIHRELWQKYKTTIPSSLEVDLMTQRGFTPGGARELISEWQRTMAVARLAEAPGTVPPSESDEPEASDPPATEETLSTPTLELPETPQDGRVQLRTVQVTYSPSEWALLQGRFPMSEDDWDAMIEVLQAMKRGLVTRD